MHLRQWKSASGKSLITRIVAGYEVTNRLAWSVHPRHLARGYLPTGTAGTCGSAAAAGKLIGFDMERMADALGVAGFILPVSTAENLWCGYSAKPLHSGYAAKLGIEAALMAEQGFAGCPVEGTPATRQGLSRDHDGRGPSSSASSIAWASTTLYATSISRCSRRAAMSTARRRRRSTSCAAHRSRREVIDRVDVYTYALSASLLNRYTDSESSMIAAQFSIPYVAAAAIVDKALGTEQFLDCRIHDPGILALARKVRLSAPMPRSTPAIPEVTPTRVEITLSNGRILRNQVDMPKGDPRSPMSESELLEKFAISPDMAVDGRTVSRIEVASWISSVTTISHPSSICFERHGKRVDATMSEASDRCTKPSPACRFTSTALFTRRWATRRPAQR